MKCRICPHNCDLSANPNGFCGGRNNYGKVTVLALDPIEKKPLYHFHPGSKILSVGSFGCNLRCGFCQNHHISMCSQTNYTDISPNELAEKAAELVTKGNIGVAYTYNEPLIGFEYVLDCVKAVHAKGLKNVLVTNGFICIEPLAELLPFIDAMNIDLKGFTRDFYKKIHGDLEVVKNTIRAANQACHVEVTTLIIPGENDSENQGGFPAADFGAWGNSPIQEREITAIAEWLASVNRNIPWHISRYFPNYEYSVPAADVGKIYGFAEIAREWLTNVYTGNC